jgi:F-type H+-transporting ATPase subunit gamma
MPSLKDFRDRISSVKSTKKITSAMKMVAASKLKKAQDQAEASQPYATTMAAMLSRVAAGVVINASSPKLLIGSGKDDVHLLVVITADRGLCGGFNANLSRTARNEIGRLQGEGKTVKLLMVGRKGYDILKRDFADKIEKTFTNLGGKKRIQFADADQVTHKVLSMFENDEFDVCTLIYNEFKSVLTQTPCKQQLIPFKLPTVQDNAEATDAAAETPMTAPYRFEPNEEEILAQLLPKNLGVQVFRALLDSAAGEQAARMQAMDNATRNAGERINDLTLEYNRARQASITRELIEIISGAEAV